MGCNGDAERIFLYSRVRFLSVSLSVDNTMIWNPNLNAVYPGISLRRLVCKNEFLGGGLFKGRACSRWGSRLSFPRFPAIVHLRSLFMQLSAVYKDIKPQDR